MTGRKAYAHSVRMSGGSAMQMPLAHREDGYPLGRWVVKKRGTRRQGRLAPDRAHELEAFSRAGRGTSTRMHGSRPRGHFEMYASREGHARVPIDWTEGGFDLGRWVDGQRSRYREGVLSEERSTRLGTLGGWTWAPFDDDWDRNFNSLEVFVGRTGGATIAQAHVEDGFRLGAWVTRTASRAWFVGPTEVTAQGDTMEASCRAGSVTCDDDAVPHQVIPRARRR